MGTVTGSGTTYDVAVSGMTGNGTVIARIPAGEAVDSSGIANMASTSTDKTVTFDNTPPTVTVNQASSQSDPTTDSSIKYTVEFSESVNDFASDDAYRRRDRAGQSDGCGLRQRENVYRDRFGMTGSGTVIVGIDAGKVHDAAGNANLASTSTDNVVQFTAPPKTFTLIRPDSGTYRIGDNVNIRWTAGGALVGSTISLCLDEDSIWSNGNEHWIEVGQVAASNGNGSYTWNISGIKPGSYFIGGYMTSGGVSIYSHLDQWFTISDALPAKFNLTAPTSISITAGQNVSIQWTASKVLTGSTVCLCYDPDTVWNGNETWIEINNAPAANGNGSYSWDTAGMPSGKYYIAGYVWSNGKPTYSHLTQPITIQGPAPATFSLTSPTSGTISAGQAVSIQWTAGNVSDGSKIALCYDTDSIWNGNEHWIEVDQAAAANGTGSYSWDTTGMPSGKYYVAGYLWSNGRPTYSHLSQPITIQGLPPSTFSLSSPSSGTVSAGQAVSIQWTAGNIGSGSKVTLCYDTDSIWNGNEHWIEVDQVAAANGSGTYSWDTTGMLPGKYYVGGYLWSNGKPTYSHMSQPITIQGGSPSSFSLTGPTSGTFTAGQTVSVQWTAANVSTGSKITLCYDADSIWNGNEHWIEVDQVAAANGSGTYSWNTTGLPPGKYYVGGYLWSNGLPTYSHLTQKITVAAALTVDDSVSPLGNASLLTEDELAPIVQEAERRLANEVGSQVLASLAGVKVQIADLPAGLLGEEVDQAILIDRDAAGYGWFVDSTPGDDSEFADVLGPNALAARDGSPAAHRVDLLTAVMHEMGHALGYDHSDGLDLMGPTLLPGVRKSLAVQPSISTTGPYADFSSNNRSTGPSSPLK